MIPAAAFTIPTPPETPFNLKKKLAEIPADNMGVGQGTMVSAIVKKMGVTQGSRTFGNDTVHVLLWTGFHQKALAERSYQRLQSLWWGGTFFRDLMAEAIAAGILDATMTDVAEAVQEVNASLVAALQSKVDKDEEPLGNVWKPLFLDGQPVLGAKEYVGMNHAIPQGTIYLDGVKLGERIVTPAPFAKPPVNSKTKTLIKNLVRAKLPIGLYARYRLSAENLTDIRVGQDAAAFAKASGVPVDPMAIRSLFKIAV